ncbi:MAG: serine/threonine-protein kinase [Acidobacteriota bacterium]
MKCKTAVPVGSGGMGEVFKAWDPDLERNVAFKYLHSTDPVLVERLLREARAQSKLDHPSVCKVYEVGEDEGRPFIAMEFVEGEPLDVVARNMSTEQKVLVIAQVTDAVQAAHSAGLIHRDLKPANILIGEDDGKHHAWVLDFGIAQIEEMPGLTVTGQLIGTPGYMSPEQARGDGEALDRRTDIFSLGVILYEILSGEKPFDGDSEIETIVNMLEGDPVMLRRRNPQAPRDLEAITMRSLEKEPKNRYQSARELADDLGRWLRGEPVKAQGVGPLDPLIRLIRRHKLVAALIVLLITGGIAGALKYTIDLNRQQQLAEAAREDAEDLVGFMLRDLFGGLQPLGRLDLLKQAATKTAAYYEKFGDEGLKPEQRIRRAQALRNLAEVIDAQGDLDKSLTGLRRAAAILETGENRSPIWRAELATTRSKIAEVLQEQGNLEACLGELRTGLEAVRTLVDEEPENARWRAVLVEILINVAWAERERGHWEQSLASLEEARSIIANRAGSDPLDGDLQFRMAEIESYTGRVLQEAGELDRAEEHLLHSRRILTKLAVEDAENPRYQFELVLTDGRLGSLAEDRGEPSSALKRYQLGLERGLQLVRRDPANARWDREVSVLHSGIGALHLAGGEPRAARDHLTSGLEISERLAARGTPSATTTNDLAWDWLQTGVAEEALGDPEAANLAFSRAVDLMAPVVSETREVWYLDTWVMALLRLGRVDEARPAVNELLAAGWNEPDFLELVQRHSLDR